MYTCTSRPCAHTVYEYVSPRLHPIYYIVCPNRSFNRSPSVEPNSMKWPRMRVLRGVSGYENRSAAPFVETLHFHDTPIRVELHVRTVDRLFWTDCTVLKKIPADKSLACVQGFKFDWLNILLTDRVELLARFWQVLESFTRREAPLFEFGFGETHWDWDCTTKQQTSAI